MALESTIPDGRPSAGRPGFNGNKTNSAQSEAGPRAELGNKSFQLYDVDPNTDYELYPNPKIVH